MATPLDDSIANLQDFCALLTATHGQLAQYASSLEDQAEQLESRDPEAEQRFGEVREHLQEFGGALENGGRDAGGRLHALEELAAGDDRPAEMVQRLDAAADAVEDGLESEGDQLDGAFGDLRSHGFEAVAQAVETARSELRAAVEEAGAACDSLEVALAATRQSLRDEEDAAARAIDEAAAALTDGSQEIAGAGDDCVAAWSAEPPGAIEPAAAEAEATLESLYGDWTASMEAHATELAGAVQDACDGAADSCGEQAEQMGAEVEEHFGHEVSFPLEDDYNDAYETAVEELKTSDPDATGAAQASAGKQAGYEAVLKGFEDGSVISKRTGEPYKDYYTSRWDAAQANP